MIYENMELIHKEKKCNFSHVRVHIEILQKSCSYIYVFTYVLKLVKMKGDVFIQILKGH